MSVLAAVSLVLWGMTLTAARARPGGVKGVLPTSALVSSLALACWVLA